MTRFCDIISAYVWRYGGSAVSSPIGVWVKAPADKRFDAYWESKSAALVAAVFVLRTNVRVHSETRKKIVAGCGVTGRRPLEVCAYGDWWATADDDTQSVAVGRRTRMLCGLQHWNGLANSSFLTN